jgi:hypothetical protein
MTLALTRLEWLGGDRFVIGSLIVIVALIGVFIVWPSIAIFIPMFTNDAGEFAPLAFMNVLSQAHIIQVILNSIGCRLPWASAVPSSAWCWRFTPPASPTQRHYRPYFLDSADRHPAVCRRPRRHPDDGTFRLYHRINGRLVRAHQHQLAVRVYRHLAGAGAGLHYGLYDPRRGD